MSFQNQRVYSLKVATVTATGDTEIVAIAKPYRCIVHRMTIANSNASARTVYLKPTGGSAGYTLVVGPTDTIDVDEIMYDAAPPGTSVTVNISGTNVTVRIEYSVQ